MRKILLRDAHPELAEQVADQSLLDTLGSGDGRVKVRWRCDRGHEWDAFVVNRVRRGDGCPYCSGRLAIPGETDLATLEPELAAELVDSTLASQLKPQSHTKVEWRCERGHTWTAPVSARVAKGNGCPYCSGRKAWPGESDLATLRPDLAAELVDQELATALKPGSNKKVEWRCKKCGNTWEQSPDARVNMGSGCPYCAHKRVVRGKNDLMTLRPDLAEQVVDKELLPELFIMSNRSVEWRCAEGHTWAASVSSRTQDGTECPYCSGRRLVAGKNDLASVYPDIASELVDSSLGSALHAYSHRIVEWRCAEGHTWSGSVSNRTNLGEGCPVCAAASFVSTGERELADLVRRHVGDEAVRCNDRRLIWPHEIDILCQKHGVGFEFNGTYWHSEEVSRRKKGAALKHSKADAVGICLMTIWDDDWKHCREVVERCVAQYCGEFDAAKDVTLQPVDAIEARAFRESHSLSRAACERYAGVFCGDELVGLFGVVVTGECRYVQSFGFAADVYRCLGDAYALLDCDGSAPYRSDNDYENQRLLHGHGLTFVGSGEPECFIVGPSTGWCRVLPSEREGDGFADSLHTVYNSGYSLWDISELL